MDRETGMYYYGARYYDPRMSIFVSVDPLAEEFPNYGGYVYTMNNPINLVDPTGMAPEGGTHIPPTTGPVWILWFKMAKNIKKGIEKFDKMLTGGFAFYADGNPGSGDYNLFRKGRADQYIDVSGFINNPFGPKSAKVSKPTVGPYATKAQELLNNARKVVEGLEDGKRVEDGMNALNSLYEVQSQEIEIPYTLNLIDTVDLHDKKIIDKEVKVRIKGKTVLDVKNKIDSLKSINERHQAEREAWNKDWKKNE